MRQLNDPKRVAVLSDGRGVVVNTEGASNELAKIENLGFRPGAWWNRTTGGIRLAVKTLAPVQLTGPEHWAAFQWRWACTAAPIVDPFTHKLLAVINVTGDCLSVHADTLRWLAATAQRIESALRVARRSSAWAVLAEAAGPLGRIDAPAIVVDHEFFVVVAQSARLSTGERIELPNDLCHRPGHVYVPELNGPCVFEPLPERGWLIRRSEPDEDVPQIRGTLDPATSQLLVRGPYARWQVHLQPACANVLRELVAEPAGLTKAELGLRLYGDPHATSTPSAVSRLRASVSGLLEPPRQEFGRVSLRPNVTIDVLP